MIERESMHQQDAINELIIRKINPNLAMRADNIGEFLVIFNLPIETRSGLVAREQITVNFKSKEARDNWWKLYKERFKEVYANG